MKSLLIPSLAVVLVAGAFAPAAIASSGAATWQAMAGHYEAIRLDLVKDATDGVATHAQALADEARSLAKKFDAGRAAVPGDKKADCVAQLASIADSATALAKATDIAGARAAFEELTEPMITYRDMVSGERPMVVYCPMVKKSWLQPDGEIGNPYGGAPMVHCGVVKSK